VGKSKSTKNTGREFESLTRLVFELLTRDDTNTLVEEDVKLDSPDGPRQFDVIVRSNVAGFDLLTVIECRDFNKKLSVTHLDGFCSKISDVNANKAILVSSCGFTKGAKRKAKRKGISLCTLHDLERGVANIGMEVPIVVMSIDIIDLGFSFVAQLEKGDSIDIKQPLLLNETPINDAIKQALLQGVIPLEKLNETFIWEPIRSEGMTAYLVVDKVRRVPLEELQIKVTLHGGYYFGYVTDLPGTIGLVDISQDERRLFVNVEDLNINYKAHFERYSSRDSFPEYRGAHISVLNMPEIKYDISRFKWNVIKRIRK